MQHPGDDKWEIEQLHEGRVQWWRVQSQRSLANNSAVYDGKPNSAEFLKEWNSLVESKSGERGIFNRKAIQDRAAKSLRRDPEVEYGTNPCGEISLRPYSFCNLTEVVIRPEDTEETLKVKIRVATALGTIQSKLTNFRYLRDIWRRNAEEERLLGVSLTGIYDNELTRTPGPELEALLTRLSKYAREVNAEFAEKLGIKPSHAITTVKPSGTVSQLVDSASGIHPRHAKYYIRS